MHGPQLVTIQLTHHSTMTQLEKAMAKKAVTLLKVEKAVTLLTVETKAKEMKVREAIKKVAMVSEAELLKAVKHEYQPPL